MRAICRRWLCRLGIHLWAREGNYAFCARRSPCTLVLWFPGTTHVELDCVDTQVVADTVLVQY